MAALDGTQFGIGGFCYGINSPSAESHSNNKVYTYIDVKESVQSVKNVAGFLNTAAAIIDVVTTFFLWIQTLLSPNMPKQLDNDVEHAEKSYVEAPAQYGVMDEVTERPSIAREFHLERPFDRIICGMYSGKAFRRDGPDVTRKPSQRISRLEGSQKIARVAKSTSPKTVETMTRFQLIRHIKRLDDRLEKLATLKKMGGEVADQEYKACKHERDRASIRLAEREQMAQNRPTAEKRKTRFIKAAIGQSFTCAVAAQ